MSFSVTFIGKPEAIKRELKKASDRMTGQSKTEFDAVHPSLEVILDQNVDNGVVRLEANGHATLDKEGKRTYGSCQCSVSVLGQLAE